MVSFVFLMYPELFHVWVLWISRVSCPLMNFRSVNPMQVFRVVSTLRLSVTLLLSLLLSRFSRVWLCMTPEMAAHQAPPSLGFSRQEHWGGLPFPSPMHESEKWKWSRSVMSDSLRPHGLQPTRLPCPWDFPGKNTGVGSHFLLQGIFQTQESNPFLLHCRQILYRLSWGKPLWEC